MLAENRNQSLISPATEGLIWQRHIEDSLQLLRFAPRGGRWVDVGSGAGFPGLVVAIASDRPVTLVEPRRRRADFLLHAARELGCGTVDVAQHRVEVLRIADAAVLSARAVAPLPELFAAAIHLACHGTLWILPKGRSAQRELAVTRESWQGEFSVEPSLTDPAAGIVLARNVRQRIDG